MHPQDRLFCEIAVQLELLTRDQVSECMQTLQRDPRGRNIGTIAISLNFMSQAEAEVVLTHQQRVLERRREARALSKGQRPEPPGTARPAAPARPAAARGTAPRAGAAADRANAPTAEAPRMRRKDPTPTAAWAHASSEPGLADAELARSVPPPSAARDTVDAEERETLDERPLGRSAKPHAGESADEASFESMGDALRNAGQSLATAPRGPLSGQPPARSGAAAPDPRASAGQNDPRASAAQQDPRASAAPRTNGAQNDPRANVPQNDPRANTIQPPKRVVASAHGTLLGPPRPAAYPAGPAPLDNAAVASRAGGVGNGPGLGGGTLLGGAALAQRHQAEASSPPARRPRPVPSGRDWRNPSRPPPPAAALDAELGYGRVAHADTLALPANDAPARPASTPAIDTPRYLDGALEAAVQSGASDLHLHSGAQLCMRVDGKLLPLTGGVAIERDVAERVIAEVLDESQRMQLALEGELRFSYELDGVGRFRAHAYLQERGTDIVFRISPSELASADKLGLSAIVRALREQPAGLCVFSGPAGAGKTTTLAALTQTLLGDRARHVVSVESPIEIVHPAGLGLVEQREVGKHVSSFAQGIELAQRQGADVIVVSDLSADTALEASLRAASARCLVLGGLRASSAVQAVTKLLRARDARQAERLRFELAHALRLVAHQRLLPRAKGAGRVPALETLVNTAQVSVLVREDKLHQLPAAMSAGRTQGMLLLDDALEELVRAGTISNEAARPVAHRHERFKGA
jgi:twitching motility protein PilT